MPLPGIFGLGPVSGKRMPASGLGVNTTHHRTEVVNGAGTRLSALCAVTIARAVKPRITMAKIVNVDEDGMSRGLNHPGRAFCLSSGKSRSAIS
jgi:hypothetical protein